MSHYTMTDEAKDMAFGLFHYYIKGRVERMPLLPLDHLDPDGPINKALTQGEDISPALTAYKVAFAALEKE